MKLLKGLRTAMKGHSKRDLLTQLIFYVGGIGQSDETIRPEQLFPYLTIALKYALLEPSSQQQEEYLYSLLKTIQKHIRAGLDVIDARGYERWHSEMWNLWIKVSERVRPRSFFDKVPNIFQWRKPVSIQMETIKPEAPVQNAITSKPSIKNEPNSQSSFKAQPETAQPSQENTGNSKVGFLQEGEESLSSEALSKTLTIGEYLQKKDIVGINNHRLTRPITKEWLEKVSSIKLIYIDLFIDLMRNEIADKKITEESKGLLFDEIIELERQKDDKERRLRMVQQELVDDEFIKAWINYKANQKIDQSIQNEVDKIINKRGEHKQYNKKELREILYLFVRRFNALKQMTQINREYLLENKRARIIEYSGDLWPTD